MLKNTGGVRHCIGQLSKATCRILMTMMYRLFFFITINKTPNPTQAHITISGIQNMGLSPYVGQSTSGTQNT